MKNNSFLKGDKRMLIRFEVKNFKGFKDSIVFDLTAREYGFNKDIVKDGYVNKAIVYGKNGVGKSSLGIAMFDIVSHLTDKERMAQIYLSNYRNLDNIDENVKFRYDFKFDTDIVKYEYEKMDQNFLVREKLTVNDEVIVDYNYFSINERYINKDIFKELNIELLDNKLSILKYLYRNTPTDFYTPLTKMIKFCENMLWYRSLSEGNSYSGFTNGSSALTQTLYESGKVKEFEQFLRENGLNYELKFENINGEKILFALYNGGKNKAVFNSIASTGTMALFLFYYWSIAAFKDISLLFIDEFDAFLHYESSEYIVLKLNKERRFQSILTSHNTYLMQNKLTRPDCCFIMTNNKITNLYNATDKEIREAHNLEKMYINGAFNE